MRREMHGGSKDAEGESKEIVPLHTSTGAVARLTRTDQDAAETLNMAIKRPVRLGMVFLLVFLLVFVIWGGFAPISGGAVAPGVISPDGSRRTVQHLEGGIIASLLVRDGDTVAEGQPLLELHGVTARATYEMLSYQRNTMLAARARLEAEAAGAPEIAFPAEFEAGPAPLLAVMETQRSLFATRRATHEARTRVLNQRVGQLEEQIRGYEAQVRSMSQQMELLADELKGKEQLFAKGLLRKPDLLQLQRAHAELTGRHGEYTALIARARQEIGEAKMQILAIDAERSDKIAEQLHEIRVKLAEIEERLPASGDVLQRTVIRAPVAGRVLNLKYRNKGAVVLAGEPILDIVPSEDKLVIEARVSPLDVDVIHPGLPAQVHLSPYSGRGTPNIPGVVKSRSADTVTDRTTHQTYYLVRVEVDAAEMARIASHVSLVPGMPAEVLIVTSQRTMIAYLFQPFLDAMRRSFRQT